jgi:amino acid adenylation domain-containing protein
VSAPRMAWHSSSVAKDLSGSLRQFSLREQIPLSTLLLSAFRVLLLRYTSQEDIVIGCSLPSLNAPVTNGSGRVQREFVLRVDLSGDPTFRTLLQDVNAHVLEALSDADGSPRPSGAYPISEPREAFQVAFSCAGPVSEPNTEPKLAPTLFAHAPVDLHLDVRESDVQESGEGLHLGLRYNAEIFEAASIERTLKNLQTLLQGIAANSDQPISKLPILTAEEQRRILVEWNQTDCEYPRDKCLHELVEAQAENAPTKLAVVWGEHHLSYDEFNSRANQLAHYLRSHGVGPNVRVGICLDPALDFAVAMLAVVKAGGACVPLDPNYPAERLAYMLEDVQARVVITGKDMLPETVPAACEVLFLADQTEVLSRQPRTNPTSGVTPRDIAYVIYTSGSTGKPRGVLLTHAGLVNYNTNTIRMYGMGPDDRMLQFCSISFDIAVEELFATWISGATLLLRSEMPLAVPDFLDWIGRHRVTILDLPTAYWHEWVHHLPELKKPVPQDLRLVVVGGEKASSNAYAAWLGAVGNRVRWINAYGPTETSVSVTAYEPRLSRGEPIPENLPIGRPLANCRIYLLDRHLNPVPVGVPGELHIGGVCVAQGYLNRPELTAEKFISDPFCPEPSLESEARLYKSGDMARYLSSGEIEFLGRRDDQVKIRGFRVELGEIESALAKYTTVRELAVIAREDTPGEKRLVAYVVPVQGAKPSATELRRNLQQHLPDYMVPSAFVFLDAMPLTPNGKIDRRGLPEPEIKSSAEPPVLAADVLQLKLVRIWEDLLGKKPIGIRDNFFELGGHSLLAARLMHRTGQALGKTLPLAMLFQAPTIEQLATVLRQDGWSRHWSSLVAIQPAGSHPPFFCVHGVGGNVLNFRELGGLMAPDHPFYGFQAQGLDGKSPCFTRIEEMAAHYIAEIKAIQPDGPYFFGGYSLGGIVAYEMAQQLRASGEQVGLLALLDTYAGNLSSISSTVLRLLMHPSRQTLLRDLPSIATETVERRIKSLLTSRLLKSVLRTNQAAADRYVLRPYAGKITLFRASESSLRSFEDLYSIWDGLAGEGVDVQKITGNHKGILVQPQVTQLAAKLKACIDKNARSMSAAASGGFHDHSPAHVSRSADSISLQPTA